MLILAAVAMLAMLVVVHELGHLLVARGLGIRVHRFSLGFGPVLWCRVWGGVEYVLCLLPLGGYVSFPEDDESVPVDPNDPDLYCNRSATHRTLVLLAGMTANFLCAFVLLLPLFALQGIPEPVGQPIILVSRVEPNSVAAESGVQPGDQVLAIDGEAISSPQQAAKRLSARSPRVHQLTLERSENLHLSVVVHRPQKGKIGIALEQKSLVRYRPAADVLEVILTAARSYTRLAEVTFGSLEKLVSGRVGLDQLSGPVGIVALTAAATHQDGFNLLFIAALVSFNLGVMNLLPLPALDGGQLFLLLVEQVRGRKLPQRTQQVLNQTGILVLFGLGLFMLVKDSLQLLLPG